MTAPRLILPGTTYLITRRCSERRLFLQPSETVNRIFLYVLALAARRYRVDVHVACVISNHYHLLVTDTAARLPAFVQYLDSLVARATNASLGRWEGFWASGASYSAVSNATKTDVIRKAAYVLANPVAAGLVASGQDWPGVWTSPKQLGAAKLRAARPQVFFRKDGGLPETAELELTVPPGFASAEEFREQVVGELAALEDVARRSLAAAGRKFLGRAKALAQKPFSRPAAGEPRRKLNPRIAAKDTSRRIEELARLVEFARAYRRALHAFRAGVQDVIFPAGTYHLRAVYGVRCAAPG